MKNPVCYLLLGLLLGTLSAKAQPPWWAGRTLDLDSIGYEWTALQIEFSNIYVSTIPETDSINPETGLLRLRTYSNFWQNTPVSQTKYFLGKTRVNNMAVNNNQLYLAGMFTDTSSLDSFQLIPYQIGQKDAFVASFNPISQQTQWRWQRNTAGDNFIHQIRYSNLPSSLNRLVASGIDNNEGWLIILDAANGQSLYEKTFPGIRTLSDAVYDSKVPGSILLTGTCSDTGYINQVPIHLHPPLTGIRTFLARYFPSNDSVVFLKSLTYNAFDFAPTMSNDAYWSAPTIDTARTGIKQLLYNNFLPQSLPFDSVQHAGFYAISQSYSHWRTSQMHQIITPFSPDPLIYSLSSGCCLPPGSELELDHWGTGPSKMFLVDHFATFVAFPMKMQATLWSAFNILQDALFYPPQPHQHKWIIMVFPPPPDHVASISQIKFSISPNPVAHGSFRVRTQDPFQYALPWLLRDLQGRVVQQGVLQPGEDEIHCGQLPKGMYFFELRSTAGSGVQKVLIH